MKHQQQTLESMRAMDAEQETQRLKLGDQLSVAREIDHFSYFAKKAGALAFANELTEDGFRVTLTRKGLTWLVEARTESDVELPTVDAFVDRMYHLVQSHGGIYDGWAAPVVLRGKE